MYRGKLQISLRMRVMVFMTFFIVALLAQICTSYYQSTHILAVFQTQSGNIYTISQLLASVEDSNAVLEGYHWDIDDSKSFLSQLEDSCNSCASWISLLDEEYDTNEEERYLLTRAVLTTYDSYNDTLDELIIAVKAGNSNTAMNLYYDRAEPCGEYLRQYVQALLETVISDGQGTHASLTALNNQIKVVQFILTGLCILLCGFVFWEIARILNPVQKMAEDSLAIAEGNFSIPDVETRSQDEIGVLVNSFNHMKHAMVDLVETLQEKNEIERELHQKQEETLKLQNLMERATMQQLRSQVNPHFLFNTLTAILHTAELEGADKTHSLITALSHLLRYSLASNDLWVPLSREIQIVNDCFAIYRTRFGSRVQMKWHISEDIDLTETMVPSFLLQPLVENAFTHGITPKEEGGCVDIQIQKFPQQKKLYVSVRDDGVGMEEARLSELRQALKKPPEMGEHIGLYNLAARMRLIDAHCHLQVSSRLGKGTQVSICIPLVEHSEEYKEGDV